MIMIIIMIMIRIIITINAVAACSEVLMYAETLYPTLIAKVRNWYLISIQWATLEQSGTSILVNLRPLEGKNREQQFHMTKRASYYWILIAIIPSEYRNNSQNIGMV